MSKKPWAVTMIPQAKSCQGTKSCQGQSYQGTKLSGYKESPVDKDLPGNKELPGDKEFPGNKEFQGDKALPENQKLPGDKELQGSKVARRQGCQKTRLPGNKQRVTGGQRTLSGNQELPKEKVVRGHC